VSDATFPASENVQRLRGAVLATVMIALMLALLLEALDQTVVGTAMPRIVAQLHGLDRYTWVVTAYVLASMTLLPITGKLSDLFGRKWFLLGGTLLFLLGSLLSGASQTMNQLIIFRAVQGLGAGIGIGLIATVFADLFEPAERAKWSGLFSLVYGVSSLLGPTLGGWLAEHGPLLGTLITDDSRWRWVFYVNLPLGIIVLLLLVILLPPNVSLRTSTSTGWAALRQIDFQGALLSAVATICIMLGLTWGSARIYAWTSLPVLGVFLVGIVLFLLFLLVERRVAEPILPNDLTNNKIFGVASLLTVTQAVVLFGLIFYLPLFLQGVLAISPTTTGLAMTAFSVSMVVGAVLGGIMISRLKRYQIVAIVAAVLSTAGSLLIALMTLNTSLLQVILIMVFAGISSGVFFSLPMLVAQIALPPSRLGVSTAATRYLGQLGATLGIAIVGAVVSGSSNLAQLPTDLAGRAQLAHALQGGFIIVLIFSALTLLATFFLKDIPFDASALNPASAQTDAPVPVSEAIAD
jgi:MFS family permease